MNRSLSIVAVVLLLTGAALIGCDTTEDDQERSIVVTYSILGSIVTELVGEEASVTVLMPDGADPHDWEPSARDIEKINNADLVVWNGLGLESGIENAVNSAVDNVARLFTAADHIEVRHVGETEFHDHQEDDAHQHEEGAPDPHFWLDPLAMKDVVTALAAELENSLDLEIGSRAGSLETRLEELHLEIEAMLAAVAPDDRKLVTGHDSMGYFARRYGFDIIGSVVPNLSTQAGVSAADIAALIDQVKEQGVKAIFVETGTSASVVQQLSAATGAVVIELSPAELLPDGSYFTFMSNLAEKIVNGLK